MDNEGNQVTRLLRAWEAGDPSALESLTALVYDDLRELARSRLRRERPGHTLQPTALVNEAFIRLVGQRRVRWQGRAHFFAIAAQAMRRVLVDYARKRHAQKRPLVVAQTFDQESPAQERDVDLLRLDDALKDLARLDPRQARIVELRFFGGLTIQETAQVLGISPATVKVDWSMAKAWLFQQLKRS